MPRCRLCSHDSPSYGGLHKHLHKHDLTAYTYYAMFPAELQARIRENVVVARAPDHLDDDCWRWQGRPCGYGHGTLRLPGSPTESAHRISFWAFHGQMPPPDLVIRHRCDVGMCVYPKHLELGTQLENVQDRNERNRTAKGERIRSNIIAEVEVVPILVRHIQGESYANIAKDYGVTKSAIDHIVNGRSFGHVHAELRDFIPW